MTVLDNANSSIPSLPSIDFYLENEIKKAATMLNCFTKTAGEEKIPRELLEIARGVVFLTIVKAGFMFTGRYGTGLVIAKLSDGCSWSAPSAVTISGLGWGLQVLLLFPFGNLIRLNFCNYTTTILFTIFRSVPRSQKSC